MVLDTSVLLAILFDEPEAQSFEAALEDEPVLLLSVASYLEAAMVVESRYGPAGGRELDLLIHKAAIEIVSFDKEQAEWSRHGFQRYGKGRHSAGLNYGDCFVYGLAVASGEPLLFKGNDFGETDLELWD
jgi:ribonuclease VapC